MTRKCKLDGCNKRVTGRKKFCCAAHRYRYHNIHNPRGKFAHLKGQPFKHRILTGEVDPDELTRFVRVHPDTIETQVWDRR